MFYSLGLQRGGNWFTNFWEVFYEASVEIRETNKDLYVFYRPWGSPIAYTCKLFLAHSDASFSHTLSEEFDCIDMEHGFL